MPPSPETSSLTRILGGVGCEVEPDPLLFFILYPIVAKSQKFLNNSNEKSGAISQKKHCAFQKSLSGSLPRQILLAR
jgi:hypothetical protein